MDMSTPAKILVVDDVEDNVLSTQALLARPGLTVLPARSAVDALGLLEHHEVALAILDVQMPVIDGFELAERMRRIERLRAVPIIFMTGNASVQSQTFQGYQAGAVDFLIKPIDPRVLEMKVGVFVELYRQRKQLHERNIELERLLRLNESMAQALRAAHGEAVREAHTDALTGVSNRRHILELGDAALADRRRDAQPVCLAILDLDHFKTINDTHGHDTGDAVLRAFCAHVGHRVRPGNVLGRLGGEEFLLLMPGTSLADAAAIIERVRQALEPHAGIDYSFSAGLAQAGVGESLLATMKRADIALYQAKQAGRDRSVTSPAPL
jgi:two-component system, cell cycle response regulator